MSRGVGFFATRADLEPGLLRIERDQSLKFVPYVDPGPAPPEYRSLLREVPDLGQARSDDHNTGHCYVALPGAGSVAVRSISQRGGRVSHLIDVDSLVGAVLLRLGGVHGDRALIAGDVSAVGKGPDASLLERRLARELTRGFEKVKGWRVGPEAAALLDAGWRLVTISLRSPAGYDLTRA